MRKTVLIVVMILISITTVQAQDFKIEVNGALPVGDIGDSYSFGASVSGSYLFEVSDTFQAGPTAGVIHYFGSSEELPRFFTGSSEELLVFGLLNRGMAHKKPPF